MTSSEPAPYAHTIEAPSRVSNQEKDVDALVIDDEQFYGEMIERVVKRIVPEGWDVRCMANAIAATYVLILDPDIKLVLLDHLMPHRLGIDVAQEAVTMRPHLRGRIIVSSGSAFDHDLHRRYEALGCIILEKPYPLAELERLILEIIAPHA